jgi:hypothetical protein
MTLSIENVILEALDLGKDVRLVMAPGAEKDRLIRLGIDQRLSEDRITECRTEALRQSLSSL